MSLRRLARQEFGVSKEVFWHAFFKPSRVSLCSRGACGALLLAEIAISFFVQSDALEPQPVDLARYYSVLIRKPLSCVIGHDIARHSGGFVLDLLSTPASDGVAVPPPGNR